MKTGRQKAADIKRRIIQACENAGLTVQGAKFYLRQEYGDRLVQVAAVTPDGPCRHSAIDIRTPVELDGKWSGCVEIACLAADRRPEASTLGQPVFIMQGREFTPLRGLADELKKTVDEREQVVAAIRLGIEGPYSFGQVSWERTD